MDIAVFRAVNGLSGRWIGYDALVIFAATWLPFVMVAVVLGYLFVSWKTTHFEGRFENTVHALWAVVIGFIVEQAIGFLWFRARPFVTLDGVVKLADRLAHEKSFPSGHATFAFALAFSIFFHNRRWGSVLLVLAAAVAFARVGAGVHYPSDVLGGAIVGFVAAKLAAPVKKGIEPYLEFFPVFRKYNRRREA